MRKQILRLIDSNNPTIRKTTVSIIYMPLFIAYVVMAITQLVKDFLLFLPGFVVELYKEFADNIKTLHKGLSMKYNGDIRSK